MCSEHLINSIFHIGKRSPRGGKIPANSQGPTCQRVIGTFRIGMKLSVLSKTPTADAGGILLGFLRGFLGFSWDHPLLPNILKLTVKGLLTSEVPEGRRKSQVCQL